MRTYRHLSLEEREKLWALKETGWDWEKGTVENTNGRIRRYIPQGTSIDLLTEEQMAFLLAYLTPYEKMEELIKKDKWCTSG